MKDFGKCLAGHDWGNVAMAEGSNAKANLYYQATVTAALERYFPLISVRKKSTDWINARIRKLVKRRKKVYRKEGRSQK